MFNKVMIAIFIFPILAFGQKIRFNPETPLYIEYKSTADPKPSKEMTLQIEDATSPSKMRLSLQAKPDEPGNFYGYLWLQLGKKITNEVIFKKSKLTLLGWLTQQDDIQALFLFDDEKQLQDFKSKALASKKPLTDKKNLPQLMNSTSVNATITTAHSKINEVAADMAEVTRFGQLMIAYNSFTPAHIPIHLTQVN